MAFHKAHQLWDLELRNQVSSKEVPDKHIEVTRGNTFKARWDFWLLGSELVPTACTWLTTDHAGPSVS